MGEGDVWLLGVNLSTKPRWIQFTLPTVGFVFGYLVNGLAEEFVYNRMKLSYGWYFTFIQVVSYSVFLLLQGFRPKQMVNSWQSYGKLSTALMLSHGFTKGSLAYLNYPAQIMFKSTKVIPVMIMGAFMPGLRRTYSLGEYLSASMLVVGLVLFTLADAATSPSFNILGVVLVCSALLMDALGGNYQEQLFKVQPTTSQEEMLFCTSVIGSVFLILPLTMTGELWVAWAACAKTPWVYLVLLFECACTFIGQLSVLCLVALFGAANTALITTARKAVTMLLSYIVFVKPLTGQHISGLLLMFFGLSVKMVPNDGVPIMDYLQEKGKEAAKAASQAMKSRQGHVTDASGGPRSDKGKGAIKREDEEKQGLLRSPDSRGAPHNV